MERRAFTCGAAAIIVAAPLAASAQQDTRVRRIGVLVPGSASNPYWRGILVPLRKLGWIEGKNLTIEARYDDDNGALLPELATELVRLRVELIATAGTAAALAAKNATSSIPIVMLSAGDPVRSGLVASLARPGGNVTGYSIVSSELRLKRLEVLQELLPAATRIGELVNPQSPSWRVARDEYEEAYRSRHMQPVFIEVSTAGQLENAVAEAARRGAHALIVYNDAVNSMATAETVMSAALRFALPTLTNHLDILEAGALVSYSPSTEGDEARAAAYVDKILRGARPAELPVEQPSKFVLGINLKTARLLAVTIPRSLLLRADHVIR